MAANREQVWPSVPVSHLSCSTVPNLLLEMNVSRVSHKAGGARLGVVETASVALSKFRHC